MMLLWQEDCEVWGGIRRWVETVSLWARKVLPREIERMRDISLIESLSQRQTLGDFAFGSVTCAGPFGPGLGGHNMQGIKDESG
jgi:hypothetical protein